LSPGGEALVASATSPGRLPVACYAMGILLYERTDDVPQDVPGAAAAHARAGV
jgi:hypothetical protein